MAPKTFQIVLNGSVQPISATRTASQRVVFQNNGPTNTMRIGDANISATRGLRLAAVGGTYSVDAGTPINLAQWYVIGTAADVLDVISDDVLF